MARPATGQTPPISFRPPKQLLKEFDATIEEGRSRSDVLIELMHERVTKKHREGPVRPDEEPVGAASAVQPGSETGSDG